MGGRPGHGEPGDGDGTGDDDVYGGDGLVVLIADPLSQDVACRGPYLTYAAAHAELLRVRQELDADGLRDVVVTLVRWHRR